MKSIREAMTSEINEAHNYSYSVAFNVGGGKIVTTELILKNSSDAKIFDKWLSSEIDNTVYHADGGPNDIEL